MKKYEKVMTVALTGKITNYPQKKMNVIKPKIVNPIIIFESDIELLKAVEITKLNKAYEKRIKNMMYRATISYWREFEHGMMLFLDKLEKISTEEGNALPTIKRVEREELVLGLA